MANASFVKKNNEKDLNQKSRVISHPNIGTWGQRRLPIIHSAEHNPRCQHFAQDDCYDDDLDVPMIAMTFLLVMMMLWCVMTMHEIIKRS